MGAPIPSRGKTGSPLEAAREVALVGEPGLEGERRQGDVALHELRGRPVKTRIPEAFADRGSEMPADSGSSARRRPSRLEQKAPLWNAPQT
jgi:hypothetical protein